MKSESRMECHDVEWKESWKDEYLKTVSAFANTEGGTLTIGVDDNGNVVGVENPEKLMKQLPDKIHNKLGITPTVRLHSNEGYTQYQFQSSNRHLLFFWMESIMSVREVRHNR